MCVLERKMVKCVCVREGERAYVCVSVAHQRHSADLDEEVRLLQVSVLELVGLVWVVQSTDQLIHLQLVVLTYTQQAHYYWMMSS